MNYAKRILDILARQAVPRRIVIAPGAPPIEKSAEGIQVAIQAILDASDVVDTLIGLREFAKQGADGGIDDGQPHGLPCDGRFSFGLPDLGRFRVSFVTQRGSKAAVVTRVPFDIPSCAEICSDAETAACLLEAMRGDGGGVVFLFGSHPLATATFAYALLKELNQRDRRIVTILESELTFLMRHESSIVIQREVGVDASDVPRGVADAIAMGSDILYLGDVLHAAPVPEIGRLVEMGAVAVIGAVAADADALTTNMRIVMGDAFELMRARTRERVCITPAEGALLHVQRLGAWT